LKLGKVKIELDVSTRFKSGSKGVFHAPKKGLCSI